MIVRNDLIEAERIEKPTLALLQPPHHRPPPQRIVSERRNHPPHKPSTTFCNKIGTSRTSRDVRLGSANWAKADIDKIAVTNRDFMSTRPSVMGLVMSSF